MPRKIIFLFFVFLLCCSLLNAQTDTTVIKSDTTIANADSLINYADSTPLQIAILAPLYLDSAFDGNTYKLKENFIPQYILTGLDFYNGVMLAIDSLQKEHANIAVSIYDTKDSAKNLHEILNEIHRQNTSLIIASFTSAAEQKTVSEFSFSSNIPVVSATYPNNAGLASNPFFIMLNPTLQTHVEALKKFLQKNYPSAKMLYVAKSGSLETRIRSYFGASLNKAKSVELTNDFMDNDLLSLLDSSRQNIIICGTANDAFAEKLVQTFCNNSLYRATIIGMPTWDAIKQLNTNTCANLTAIYTTAYNFNTTTITTQPVYVTYKDKVFSRPSDVVLKGFESMYHFTHLLLQYKTDFINHLSESSYIMFNNYNIQPATIDAHNQLPDYLENKMLYIVKKSAGKTVIIPAAN